MVLHKDPAPQKQKFCLASQTTEGCGEAALLGVLAKIPLKRTFLRNVCPRLSMNVCLILQAMNKLTAPSRHHGVMAGK